MPPRKRARTDHVQGSTPTRADSTTHAKTGSKAVTVATTDVLNGGPVAHAVFKLRRGCLKDIPNFAVEIQLMIFGNLHPQDLFNLSRTSKTFHGFFLHRSNEALWEAALKNAEDLPKRPPWMSIPRFIHLLYSTHCHNCGCPNIRKVIWMWLARYCSACLEKVTYRQAEAQVVLRDVDCKERVEFLLNCILSRGNTSKSPERRYLKRQVDGLAGQWSALPRPIQWETVCRFVIQCQDDLQAQMKYAEPCEKWHKKLEDARKNGLRNGRTERFDAIIEKLRETGWEEDLDFLGKKGLEQMSRLPVVRQSAKLSDKGWQKVQTALHTFLNETRSARLKYERETLIRDRFAELDKAITAHCVTIPRDATMDCRPVALDLALQAELEPVANAPSSEIVTQETFSALVPQLVASWKDEQRQFLQAFLGRFITNVPSDVDILDLAVAIVYTGQSDYKRVCKMRYPYILAQGFRSHYAPDSDRADFPLSHYAAPAADRAEWPYNLNSLKPKQVETGIKWMRNIVTKLGLKPDTATFSDLEQCGARLRCLKCAEQGQGQGQQRAYTWEAAFSHTAEHDTARSDDSYPRSSHTRWARVGEADMVKVKEREAIAHALTADSECQWSCALCVHWTGSGGEGKWRVREHLASKHNIADANGAIQDGTIFWSPVHNYLRKPAVEL